MTSQNEYPQKNVAEIKPYIGIRAYQNDVRFFYPENEIDWIVDHVRINPHDIIVLASENIDPAYKRDLQLHGVKFEEIRKIPFKYPLRFMSHLKEISKAGIWAAIWNTVMDFYPLKHYIVYNDFTELSRVRNRVLNERGCQTWYYTHSCNTSEVFGSDEKLLSFDLLNYDHLIAWNDCIANHFLKHGGVFRSVHIVGCLWSDE